MFAVTLASHTAGHAKWIVVFQMAHRVTGRNKANRTDVVYSISRQMEIEMLSLISSLELPRSNVQMQCRVE